MKYKLFALALLAAVPAFGADLLLMDSGMVSVVPEKVQMIPHGEMSSVSLEGDTLTQWISWTRGFGLAQFDVSDPKNIKLSNGILLYGYPMHHVKADDRGDIEYLSTMFGLSVLEKNQGKYQLRRNMLLDFSTSTIPAKKTAVASQRLLLSGNRTNRLYNIVSPAEPILEKMDFAPGFNSFVSDGKTFFSRKKDTVYSFDLKGNETELFKFKGSLANMIARPDCFLLLMNGTLKIVPRKSPYEIRDALPDTGIESVTAVKDGYLAMCLGGVKGFFFTVGKDLKVEKTRDFVFPFPVISVCYDDGRFACMRRNDTRDNCLFDDNMNLIGEIPVVRNDSSAEIFGQNIFFRSKSHLFRYSLTELGEKFAPASVLELPAPEKGHYNFDAYNFPDGILHYKKFMLISGYLLSAETLESLKVLSSDAPVFRDSVAEDDGTAYLNAGKELLVLDLKALPEIRTIRSIPAPDAKKPLLRLQADSSRLYVIDTNDLHVFNKQTGALEKSIPCDSPKTLELYGDYVYVPSGSTRGDLTVCNIRTGEVRALKGLIRHGVGSSALYRGNLFLADGATTIRQFDLAKPFEPVERVCYETTGPKDYPHPFSGIRRIIVAGGKLYAKIYSRIICWDLKECF